MPDLSIALRLRNHQFETGECEYCRYFTFTSECAVLEQEVDAEQVCDAWQGDEKEYIKFEIDEADIPSFAKGMKRVQPYKHIVIGGHKTPVGFLLIIEDTMEPRPHRFSLDMDFSSAHLGREHHWTQKEVERIIKLGKNNAIR